MTFFAQNLLLTITTVIWLFAYANAKDVNNYVEHIVGKGDNKPIIELHEINDYLVDFAQLNGYVFIDKEHQLQKEKNHENKEVVKKTLSNHFSVTIPLTLFPSPYPRELFEEAWELQEVMAKVHLRVSLNYEFLKKTMADVAKMNPEFIGKMVEIMDAVKDNRKQSGMTLLLQRSDYLSHVDPHNSAKPISIKQIEVSTGVHGGQGLSPNPLHARVMGKVKYSHEAVGEPVPEWMQSLELKAENSAHGQAWAFYQAWLAFTKLHNDTKAIILLINPAKRSAHSHFQERKWVQFTLEDIARKEGKGRPRVADITFAECETRLTFANGHVFLDGDRTKRVAIILHGGYLPAHFSGERDWEIRLQMEQSEAVMVPNVFTFLAGTKKVQQVLAEPRRLEQFFPELNDPKHPGAAKLQKELDMLRATFSPMWALGNDSREERTLMKRVMANPDDYVLKENLEGGRGNFFGQKLKQRLMELKKDPKTRSLYILQKIIRPFTVKNVISPVPPAPQDNFKMVEVNSELSIFGALLAKTGTGNINNTVAAAEEEASNAAAVDQGELHGRRHKRMMNAEGSHPAADEVKQPVEQQVKQPVEQQLVFNNVDGYLVRTKMIDNVMCTLGSGLGGADSLALFQMSEFDTKIHVKAGGEQEHCAAAGEQFAIGDEEDASDSEDEKEVD